MKKVDVAIIGAGSAGLYALSVVKRFTDNFVLINKGKLGTTCARVGCMPSKVLIQSAHYASSIKYFSRSGINSSSSIDIKRTLENVREYRDSFTAISTKTVHSLKEKFIDGKVKFLNKNTLIVNNKEIEAKAIIIATGSTPIIPAPWEKFRDKILTTDEVFEENDLPKDLAVVGLGPIGLELGQALSKLGLNITGIHSKTLIGGLSDEKVNSYALKSFSSHFDLLLGSHGEIALKGEKLAVKSGDKEIVVDKVIASLGRTPNLQDLGLEDIGIVLEKGVPSFDPHTMQIEDTQIFIAGDVNSDRAILHEAGDEGRIAGFNAINSLKKFKRKTPLGIIFSEPNIAFVGKKYYEVKQDNSIVIGEFDFAKQGRAIIKNSNEGMIRVYVDKKNATIVGAEMFCIDAEHFAHFINLAIEEKISIFRLLQMSYYHPTTEEGLYNLFLDVAKKIGFSKESILELSTL